MAHIRWEPEGEATLVMLDGDRLELLSTRSFPPGARPRGAVVADAPMDADAEHGAVAPASAAEPAGKESATTSVAPAPLSPAGASVSPAAPTPSAEPAAFWIKVHGSHRQPDGRFRVEGRLLDATRALRERLARIVAAS